MGHGGGVEIPGQPRHDNDVALQPHLDLHQNRYREQRDEVSTDTAGPAPACHWPCLTLPGLVLSLTLSRPVKGFCFGYPYLGFQIVGVRPIQRSPR